MSYIELRNIKKTIGKNTVLDDISLRFDSGVIYGLKGKNGCGKTMLMRMICGLILPTEGEVIIDGKVLHRDQRFPDSMGALIENPSFLPSCSGFDNLKLLAGLTGGISTGNIRLSMERVGLDPDDGKKYRKYSLGMKQKLGIANAIMGEPEIIILDEPINALDEESVVKVKQVLLELRDRNHLIIIACHDREELEYLSDVIIHMKDGRVTGSETLIKEDRKQEGAV